MSAARVPGALSRDHRRMLFEESGISLDVAAERETFTAWRGADVPQGGGELPAKPGQINQTPTP